MVTISLGARYGAFHRRAGGIRAAPAAAGRDGYWRAMAMRISLSVSVIRSPDRSTVTVRSVPVNRNGDR
jgi:hypothetical protein